MSEQRGKDTAGEYLYLKDDEGRRVYDLHAHPIVDHDLYNLRRYLHDQSEQQIAVAQTEEQKRAAQTAYNARLNFVTDSPGIADTFREWGREQGFAFCFDQGEDE